MIWLDEVDSTNNYIKAHREEIPPFTLVLAHSQSAGRGQRGNSWESAPGENLTFSFHFSPPEGISPVSQFVISEAIALAMCGSLEIYGIKAKVKWPNDIYVGDRKICGILIENSIMGYRISDSISGVGLNVNQSLFVSSAPNPVSMRQLTDRRYELEEIAESVKRNIDKYFGMLDSERGRAELDRRYHESLWRKDGEAHRFRACESGEEFNAEIIGVDPTGHIVLRDEERGTRRYAFKEVSFII